MSQIIRASLDLFVAFAIIITFGQDLYRMTLGQSSTANPIQASANGITQNGTAQAIPQMTGVAIYVTDNLRKQLSDLLAAEKYNVKMQSYKFEGADWWFETIINYGHIVVVYVLMTKYKTQTNEQSKKKIMYIGGALVLFWMFFLPQFKQTKLTIDVKGLPVYTNNKIVPNEIISAINDEADLQDFVNDDIQF